MQRGRSASAPQRHSAYASPADVPASRPRTLTIVANEAPHVPGSASCLCSLCHPRASHFPRRRDGRIVLPTPTPPRRLRASSQSIRGVGPAGGAYREGSADRPVHSGTGGRVMRRGEALGQFGTVGRIEDLVLPPLLRDFDFHNFPTSSTIRGDEPEIQSTRSDRLRPSRKKPYDIHSRPGPDPWGNASNSETSRIRPATNRSNLANPPSGELRSPYAEVPPSQPSASSSVGHSAWRTSYEAIVEESSQQSSDPFGIGENRPTSVATSGPWLLGSPGKQRPTFHPTALQSPVHLHQTFQADKGRRSPAFVAPRTPSIEQTQVHSGNREVTSRRASPHEISNSDLVDPPKVIRFNSFHNPVPETWASRPSEHGDSEGDYSQSESPPQQSTNTGVLRFQRPVVPDSQLSPSTSARESPVFHVKWDSERKRRQGYFAQDEGSEKSPFRHYNKAGCDYNA